MKLRSDEISKSGRGNRGSGGKHSLTPIIRYHTGQQGYLAAQGGCIHATGWNNYWSSWRQMRHWSVNGFWGASWHSCWGACIAELLPDLLKELRCIDTPRCKEAPCTT